MAQTTNLNIAPYYDDYQELENYHRVLFRPGFSIQARELTTLQSILQNQIERMGNHIFKEGAVVIPGQVSYSDSYYSVKLSPTFAEERINLDQYYDRNNPVILTGETGGVQYKVIGVEPKRGDLNPYLYIQQLKAGSNAIDEIFANGENLSANIPTLHTSRYDANVA